MNRFKLAVIVRLILGLVLAPHANFADVRAAEVMTPHPMIERTSGAFTKQL
jgi:hypothetical protein